jgi:methyl halide transferase
MTDWENRYQLGETPWEKGQAAPPLTELLSTAEPVAWGAGPVLVPGCGFGHDVRILAAHGLTVVGLDLSPTAIERARAFPQVHGETYELGNFMDPDWLAGRQFSAIWEHTCFCAIDPADRSRYAKAAASCLPDDGLLAGVFFLTPFDPGAERPGPPHGVTLAELEAEFSPYFKKVRGWVPHTAYAGREGREWIGIFRKHSQP